MSESPAPSPLPPEQPSESAAPQHAVPSPAPESTGLPSNVAAGLACLLSIVGGIVFLVLEKKDQFVRFYAMQSTILGGLSLAFSIALQIAAAILHLVPFVGNVLGILLSLVGMVAGLAFFAAWVVTVIKSFSGKEWEVPYLGKIAREQLAKYSPTPP